MGRRTEPRIAISFPVTVRGFDSQGSPFSVTAETHDISSSGASLRGIEGLVQPGKKIEIEFRDQSAWFRVQWVGGIASRAGRVGVRCLERKYIWNVPAKPWEADTFNHAPASTDWGRPAIPWEGGERRGFPRRPCRIETQVSTADASFRLPGTVTDLSLSGCYVEMLSPLPVDTNVELVLAADNINLHLSGKVRTSQNGLGMGVAFTSMTPVEFEQLRRLAPPAEDPPSRANIPAPPHVQSQSPPQPQSPYSLSPPPAFSSSPPASYSRVASSAAAASVASIETSGPTASDAIETLVRILLRKGIVTRQELSAEFEKLKAAKT